MLPALLVLAALGAEGSGPAFIEDDYPKALARAKQRQVPLLVDASTTWCHSCRFLKATVLQESVVGAQANRFVWLSIDFEKPENAAFSAKYPVRAFPTLLFIDPAVERVALQRAGSLSTARFLSLLDQGEAAVRGAPPGSLPGSLRDGQRLDALGKSAEAANAYAKAVEAAAPGSADRGRALESEVLALQFAGKNDRCAEVFLSAAPGLPRDGAFVDSASTALGCALDPPTPDPQILNRLAPFETEALAVPDVNDDDRSSLLEEMVSFAEAQRKDVAKAAASWLSFLDAAAARARSVEQRAALDPHRIKAAKILKQLPHIRPLIEKTARELPDDFNAHARLATLYTELGLKSEALGENAKAVDLAYGPSRVRLLEKRSQLETAVGDPSGAMAALERALAEAERIPGSQRRPQLLETLEKERAALNGSTQK
jgi:tetratricopeptide (TPR) repeat protein